MYANTAQKNAPGTRGSRGAEGGVWELRPHPAPGAPKDKKPDITPPVYNTALAPQIIYIP